MSLIRLRHINAIQICFDWIAVTDAIKYTIKIAPLLTLQVGMSNKGTAWR